MGALTISICRRVCHGVRGGHGGDGPGFRCELGSWDELWSIFQLIAVNV